MSIWNLCPAPNGVNIPRRERHRRGAFAVLHSWGRLPGVSFGSSAAPFHVEVFGQSVLGSGVSYDPGLVEEEARQIELEPWMVAKLFAVTEVDPSPESKHAPRSVNYGWQPLRDVLLIMLDCGIRPNEVFSMRKEHVKWDRDLIFVPRGKSRKSQRFVPMSERGKAALHARFQTLTEDSPYVFLSARSSCGHIVTVQKQFDRARKLAGLPKDVVLYCVRHRFGTEVMEGTGNVMAVMDVMGHSRVDVTRLYQHPGLKQIGMAINRRNQMVH